jgi:hypothetical protein
MTSNMEDSFIEFYNKLKENNLFKNNLILEEPNIKERFFMIEFKRSNESLKIYDNFNPKNEFIYNSLCINYNSVDDITYNILSLYDGDFFMNDLEDILYPNKSFTEISIIEAILKIYKVIEYFDYLVKYNNGKKVIDWYDWRDWNDYNF